MNSILKRFYERMDALENVDVLGFNNDIPFLGKADLWYDCHGCGNATAYLPKSCRKCYGISFEKIVSFRSKWFSKIA